MKRSLVVVAAIAVYLAAVLVWVGSDKRVSKHAFDEFSIANTGDKGTSLAAKYLAHTGHRVDTLALALNERNADPHAAVFRLGAAPVRFSRDDLEEESAGDRRKRKGGKPKPRVRTHYVTPLLSDEEDSWVRHGGRLIVGASGAFGSLDTGVAPEKLAKKVFPLWPGLETLNLPAARTVSGEALRNAHAVYAVDGKMAMARIAVGAGDVLVFAVPEALDNQHVAAYLPLLTALAGGARHVYFDETIHGMTTGEGTIELLKEWRLGPFLLLLLILAAVIFWRGGTRVGRPDDEFRDTRSEAIDLVGSLGALYERSMTKGEALAAYYHELTRAVAASSGLRGDALHKRVAELTGNMTQPWKHQQLSEEEFQRMLTTLNGAFGRV